jgi:hypothetical protein
VAVVVGSGHGEQAGAADREGGLTDLGERSIPENHRLDPRLFSGPARPRTRKIG